MATILDQLRSGKTRFGIRAKVGSGRNGMVVVAVDHGNDALKGAVLGTDGTLHTIRVPACYAPAQEIRAGEGEITYRVGEGLAFWMGESAIQHRGDGLPVGPTPQRVVDPRLQEILAATITELLCIAQYPAGTYQIALGFGIPNWEIIRVHERESAMGVAPGTRTALERHVKHASWSIERTDPHGAVTRWRLTIGMVIPQAQSTGALVMYTRTPEGTLATDLDALTIIDIGGGDVQGTELSFHPHQMITTRLGDGTIRIANALRQHFGGDGTALPPIAAQQALITRRLLVSGKRRDITAEVNLLLRSHGQAIVADMLPTMRQNRTFVLLSGGGVVLLHDLLAERLQSERLRGRDYEMIPPAYASVCNAIGLLFASILLANRMAEAHANPR